jgi:hypothetical protein
MGEEHVTVITCDRCGVESRYEGWGCDEEQRFRIEWAAFWPTTVTPVRDRPPWSSKLLVCPGCLTDTEKEQLVEVVRDLQVEEEIPR